MSQGQWSANEPPRGFGPSEYYNQPPQPPGPPPMPPKRPKPPKQPPAPSNPVRALAVALLNLSGLGIGFALIRRWVELAVCLVATAVLLVIALPADENGVSGALLIGYLAFLLLAAVLGGVLALHRRLSWPPRAWIALALGVVLLAAPAGSAVAYHGAQHDAQVRAAIARHKAYERAQTRRLNRANNLVKKGGSMDFSTAESEYTSALAIYKDLYTKHADADAAKKVPAALRTFYTTVGAPYAKKDYCGSIDPLTYLRTTVKSTISAKELGSLADWPDSRLPTALYQCGVKDIGKDASVAQAGGKLYLLMSTFPKSADAKKVEPALKAAVTSTTKAVKGGDPCGANARLSVLREQAGSLPAAQVPGAASALSKDAKSAGAARENGTYACGIHQYKSKDFKSAVSTLQSYRSTYKKAAHRSYAAKVIIAATIAESESAAGKKLPQTHGGSIPLTISNDSPDAVTILFTGSTTGSVTIGGCKSCTEYSSQADGMLNACKAHKSYPKKTLHLPTGTLYVLQESASDSSKESNADTFHIRSGYTYTDCAYSYHELDF